MPAKAKPDKASLIASLPREIRSLAQILRLKIYARRAGILGIKMLGDHVEMTMSSDVRPIEIHRLLEANRGWAISGDKLRIRRADLGPEWVTALESAVSGMRDRD